MLAWSPVLPPTPSRWQKQRCVRITGHPTPPCAAMISDPAVPGDHQPVRLYRNLRPGSQHQPARLWRHAEPARHRLARIG
jgi:hypothetical protein